LSNYPEVSSDNSSSKNCYTKELHKSDGSALQHSGWEALILIIIEGNDFSSYIS